jgi:hypothetical protein
VVADAAFPSPPESLEEAWKEDQLRRCLSKQNPGQVGEPKVGGAGCVASSPDERSDIRDVDPDMLRSRMLPCSCRLHTCMHQAIAGPEDTCEWSHYFRELSIELTLLLRLVSDTRTRSKL